MFCHGYGCQFHSKIELAQQDWEYITEPLQTTVSSPERERRAIAESTKRFEQVIGNVVGTSRDLPGSPIFTIDKYQLDCIDEATNTTTLLLMLAAENRLHWHRVEQPVHRSNLWRWQWPHNAARIQEIATHDRYVIDSWFHGNGHLPEIVPLELWSSGWKPTHPTAHMQK